MYMYHRRMMILFFIVFIITMSYYNELKEGFNYYDKNISSSKYAQLYEDYRDLLIKVNDSVSPTNLDSYYNYIRNTN
jgi:hypothetical protein